MDQTLLEWEKELQTLDCLLANFLTKVCSLQTSGNRDNRTQPGPSIIFHKNSRCMWSRRLQHCRTF
jgi:hypothetical protein